MIIIRFIGGLGNQMFQYGFYHNLKVKGYEVKADLTDYRTYKLHNGFELEKVFDIKLEEATINDIRNIKDNKQDILNKIRRKMIGYNSNHILQKDFSYSQLEKEADIYLDGYWQSEKYDESVSNSIIENFKFKKPLMDFNFEIAQRMMKEESISIHIRRGDYLKKENQKIFASCTLDYYMKGINYFETNFNKPQFFVFSDDINWVKKNINFFSEPTYINHNQKGNSFEDMRLMSVCKHNIIANSSFSWWGANINPNKKKIVFHPTLWWNDLKRKNDIYFPLNWKEINND